MDEPQATRGDPRIVEEPRPSQDFAKMTKPVMTCGDVRGAKLSKQAADQCYELVDNLHKGGHLGSQNGDERELLKDPCKVDVEALSVDPCISHHSMDSCVTITEDTAEEDVDPQPIDNHGVDLLCGLPRTSSVSGGSQVGDDKDQEKNLEGNEAMEPGESSKLLEEDQPEQECPICTELYDTTQHKQSLLNCNHVFCDNCIKTIVNTANGANLCRVTCPICRQTTPMLEWEVRKMQESLMESGGVCVQQDYVPPPPPTLVRRPGLCGALEYRFHKRFQTGRLFLFPPCIQNPQRLMSRLTRLEHRCRCLYLFALVFLLFAEFFCFTFLFLPILIFILMIVLGK